MSSSLRKLIRVYPRHGYVDEVKVKKTSEFLLDKLKDIEHQVQFRIDRGANFYEIQYCAEDGLSNLGIDYSEYHIWELCSTSYGGGDWLEYMNESEENKNKLKKKAIYRFDKIELIGNQENLHDFYTNLYDRDYRTRISGMFENPIDNKIELEISGQYTASNQCEIGDEYLEYPIEVKEFEFYAKPKITGSQSGIYTMIFDDEGFYFKEFLFDEMSEMGRAKAKTIELEEVRIFYQGRITRKYSWVDDDPNKVDKYRYGNWECRSSDYWDNCINPNWVEFRERMRNQNC